MTEITPKYYTSQEILEEIRQKATPLLSIPKGDITGMASINKFGANASVTKETTEDIWDGGGDYPFPTTADITHLSQKVDQAAMQGALIEIQGLDSSWELVVQTKTLDAADTTTPVALDTPLIRVFRLKVLANVVGDQIISVHNTANNQDYAIMGAGNNQTLMAIYCVPAGKTAYLTKYYATVVESTGKEPKSTRFGLWMADRGNGYEFQLKHAIGIPKAGSMAQHDFEPYAGTISEKTDIKITANPVGENGDVAAGFDLILIDN